MDTDTDSGQLLKKKKKAQRLLNRPMGHYSQALAPRPARCVALEGPYPKSYHTAPECSRSSIITWQGNPPAPLLALGIPYNFLLVGARERMPLPVQNSISRAVLFVSY